MLEALEFRLTETLVAEPSELELIAGGGAAADVWEAAVELGK